MAHNRQARRIGELVEIEESKKLWAEFYSVLDQVGRDKVWRPLCGHDGRIITGGVGHDLDGHEDEIAKLDLRGRTVVDMGCNFGHYVFLALKYGAAQATGVDMDPGIVRGAQILARIKNRPDAHFKTANMLAWDKADRFDTALFIDILGKDNISSGHLDGMLDCLDLAAKSQIFMSFRPQYYVRKHLGLTPEKIFAMYGREASADGYFMLEDHVREKMTAKGWDMRCLSPANDDFMYKKAYLLTK